MKLKFLAAALTGALMAFAGAGHATVINGSFESGLSGWGVTTDASGAATTVASHDGLLPIHGNAFALVEGGGDDVKQFIYQDISLGIGQHLKGWAFFTFHDSTSFLDYGFVEIYNSGGGLVATPFFSQAVGVGWTPWQFTASSADTYQLRMGTANNQDFEVDGHAGFDFVRVPEPGTLALFGLGLAGLGLARRRKAAA